MALALLGRAALGLHRAGPAWRERGRPTVACARLVDRRARPASDARQARSRGPRPARRPAGGRSARRARPRPGAPSSVRTGASRPPSEERRDAIGIDLAPRAQAPTRAPSGRRASASPMSDPMSVSAGSRHERRRAPSAPGSKGSSRERGADQPPLPAVRRVDELLELRPAEGLGEDAPGDDVGERVDADPVARLRAPGGA